MRRVSFLGCCLILTFLGTAAAEDQVALEWGTDFQAALEQAAEKQRPILMHLFDAN